MFCCRRARSPSPTHKDAYHRSQSLSPSRKARAKSPSLRIVNSNAKGTLSLVWMSICSNVELALRRLVGNYRIRFCYAETRAGSPIPDSNPLARSSTVARKPPLNSKHLVCPEHSFDLYWWITKKASSDLLCVWSQNSIFVLWHSVQRQTSMQLHTDWDHHEEQEKSSSKGRGFLKSLLTRRRWRNDESLYSYLDEYWLLECWKQRSLVLINWINIWYLWPLAMPFVSFAPLSLFFHVFVQLRHMVNAAHGGIVQV